MNRKFLILSLFACMSAGLVAQSDVNKSCSYASCCKLKTCAPKPISKPTTITKSGCYCLTDDICGQITIAADNVTLDLNCHEVNGNGADAAIAADGQYNVTVKNGTVSNFLVVKNRGVGVAPNRCGVAISNGTDIELHDLNVISTDPVGMALTDCQGLNISGCDFSQNDQALLLSGCRNGKVSCCAAYDNINTNTTLETSAVVSCEFCDCIELVEVDVCNNTKNIEILSALDPRVGICTVAFSSNVSLERCKVNGNSTDLPSIIVMNNVFFLMSGNCTMTDCQANNNFLQDGRLSAIIARFSPGCVLRRTQCNGNSIINATLGIALLPVCSLALSPGSIIEGCQSNNNSLTGNVIVGGGDSNTQGFNLGISSESVIRDCQANGNFSSSGVVDVVLDSNNCQIRNCQFNNNSATTQCTGILLSGNNLDIIDCQINNNFSQGLDDAEPGEAVGIAALGSGMVIQGCEINNTTCVNSTAAGIAALGSGMVIEGCEINNTTCVNNNAGGIVLNPGSRNVVVKCCQVFDTVSSSSLPGTFAVGIAALFANDISIQDCQVYDTRGNNAAVAAGIGTNFGALRCNIEGCVVNNTTAANGQGFGIGFLSGATNDCTVKDCTAIGNFFGFFDFTGFNNFFAGNYAEANVVVDYAGVTATPVVFDKSAGSFGATPNRWSNIQAVV